MLCATIKPHDRNARRVPCPNLAHVSHYSPTLNTPYNYHYSPNFKKACETIFLRFINNTVCNKTIRPKCDMLSTIHQILLIKRLTLKHKLNTIAVTKDGLTLQYLQSYEQTDKLCKIAIKQNPAAFKYIINKNTAIAQQLLTYHDVPHDCTLSALHILKQVTYKECADLILKHNFSFKLIKNLTPTHMFNIVKHMCFSEIDEYYNDHSISNLLFANNNIVDNLDNGTRLTERIAITSEYLSRSNIKHGLGYDFHHFYALALWHNFRVSEKTLQNLTDDAIIKLTLTRLAIPTPTVIRNNKPILELYKNIIKNYNTHNHLDIRKIIIGDYNMFIYALSINHKFIINIADIIDKPSKFVTRWITMDWLILKYYDALHLYNIGDIIDNEPTGYNLRCISVNKLLRLIINKNRRSNVICDKIHKCKLNSNDDYRIIMEGECVTKDAMRQRNVWHSVIINSNHHVIRNAKISFVKRIAAEFDEYICDYKNFYDYRYNIGPRLNIFIKNIINGDFCETPDKYYIESVKQKILALVSYITTYKNDISDTEYINIFTNLLTISKHYVNLEELFLIDIYCIAYPRQCIKDIPQYFQMYLYRVVDATSKVCGIYETKLYKDILKYDGMTKKRGVVVHRNAVRDEITASHTRMVHAITFAQTKCATSPISDKFQFLTSINTITANTLNTMLNTDYRIIRNLSRSGKTITPEIAFYHQACKHCTNAIYHLFVENDIIPNSLAHNRITRINTPTMLNALYDYDIFKKRLIKIYKPKGNTVTNLRKFVHVHSHIFNKAFIDISDHNNISDNFLILKQICKGVFKEQYLTNMVYKLLLQNKYEQSERLCKSAVTENGLLLAFISDKNRTHDICLHAVKQNGFAILLIKDQTMKLCTEAVKQQPYAIAFVKNQTDNLCKIALKGSARVYEYIKNPTKCVKNYYLQEYQRQNYSDFDRIPSPIYKYVDLHMQSMHSYIDILRIIKNKNAHMFQEYLFSDYMLEIHNYNNQRFADINYKVANDTYEFDPELEHVYDNQIENITIHKVVHAVYAPGVICMDMYPELKYVDDNATDCDE